MKFRVSINEIRNAEMVEVLDNDGALLATINQHQRGLHIVSKHFTGTERPRGSTVMAEIAPSVLVLLDPTTRH